MTKAKAKVSQIAISPEGCSIAQLAEITGKTRPTIRKRIRGVPHSGKKGNYPLYNLQDALKQIYQVDFAPKKSNKISGGDRDDSQNPFNRKTHFEAELKKIEFEVKKGELMQGGVFYDELATAFKITVSNLENLPDILESEVGLTLDQKERVESTIRDLRVKMHEQITSHED